MLRASARGEFIAATKSHVITLCVNAPEAMTDSPVSIIKTALIAAVFAGLSVSHTIGS